MSFGNGKGRNNNPNQKLYGFKIKIKDLPEPHFEIVKKEDDEWVLQEQTCKNVNGNIVAVEAKENVYQGDKILSTSVVMEDGDDLYFVTIPMNGVGRAIINKLVTLTSSEQLKNVEISVYQGKPKKEGDKTYPQGNVRVDDQPVKWKFENTEMPEVPRVKLKGKLVGDYTEMDQFFFDEVKKWSETVKKLRGVVSKTAAPKTETPKSETPKSEAAPKTSNKKVKAKNEELPADENNGDGNGVSEDIPF